MFQKFKLALLLTILAFNAYVHCNESKFINCPLVWSKLSTSEAIPSNSVPAGTSGGETQHYIIRALTSSNKYVVGRYYNGRGYVVENNVVKSYNSFEILTNPHRCETSWMKYIGNTPSFAVPSQTSASTYVGRAITYSISQTFPISIIINQLSGEISSNKITIVKDHSDPVSPSPQSFDFLRSYSRGLTLKMTNFQFDRNPFSGRKEFVGMDLIYNKAATFVKQIVTHRKKVIETSEITSTSISAHTFSSDFSIEPKFQDAEGVELGANLAFGAQSDKQSNSSIINQEETIVEVTREIRVPPHTSVQICSTVSMIENFSVNYIARAAYSAPGLKAAEVLRILGKPFGTKFSVSGDSIILNDSGTFAGTLPLSTQFIVAYAEDPAGCEAISRKIRELKKIKKAGILSEKQVEALTREINGMIKGVKSPL